MFGQPTGPFGTPVGVKSSTPGVVEGTPTSAASNRAKYLGNLKALNLQVGTCILLVNKYKFFLSLINQSASFMSVF